MDVELPKDHYGTGDQAFGLMASCAIVLTEYYPEMPTST